MEPVRGHSPLLPMHRCDGTVLLVLAEDQVLHESAFPPRSPRRRRWLLPVALVVVLVAVLATLQLRRDSGDEPSADGPAGQDDSMGQDDPLWRTVLREDFSQDVPVRAFTSSDYGERWSVYSDGWRDTSGVGTYAPSRVLSVEDGALVFDIHAEGGEYLGAALTAEETYGQRFGRFSVRWRADPVPGYGLAFLLWPDSEQWPADGEIDFPEGWLDGTITATAHHANPEGGKEQFNTGVTMTDWHVTTIEWTPSAVTFHLDGRLVGTSTTDVPQDPMHWVMQAGTNGSGTPPPDDARGRIQIDWLQVDAYGG